MEEHVKQYLTRNRCLPEEAPRFPTEKITFQNVRFARKNTLAELQFLYCVAFGQILETEWEGFRSVVCQKELGRLFSES